MSSQLIGKQIDAIYHTAVVVYNLEICYGQGISVHQVRQTPYGRPIEEIKMGTTQVDYNTFKDFIHQLKSKYTANNYHILNFNCNNFSNEVCEFLVGKSIPSKILNLPSEFLSTPLGQMIMPMLNQAFQHSEYANTSLLDSKTNDMVVPTVNEQMSHFTKDSRVYYPENDAEYQSIPLKNAVVMFTSSTCAPCQHIKPMVIKLANTVPYPSPIFKIPNSTIAIIVDTSKCRSTASQFQISAVPMFLKFENGKSTKSVRGADINAVQNLFDYTATLRPSEKSNFTLNKQFNATKNAEKLKTFNLQFSAKPNEKDYIKALDIDMVNWYAIFDHLRIQLTLQDASEFQNLISLIISKLHGQFDLKFLPTWLCAFRVFINMFNCPNILLFEQLRNALMQLIPDVIQSALFEQLKPSIEQLLLNIGIWIRKRQLNDNSEFYSTEDDDLFLMEFVSVGCEFINKNKGSKVLDCLKAVYLKEEEKELMNAILIN
jgi:thiol-disulfide isomerase/thioredoxin